MLPRWTPRALEVALLVLVAALAAFGVSTALRLATDDVPAAAAAAATPPATLAPLEAFATIAERDLFNAGAPSASPAADGRLRVVGVGMQGTQAWAAVEDTTTHRQTLVHAGDALGNGRVTAIAWDHIVLAGRDGDTVLEVARAPAREPTSAEPVAVASTAANVGVRQTSTTGFVVDRRELAGAVDDMSGLMTQLRAVPEVEDGRAAGFRLFQIKDDSLFRRLGLENGDVVQRMNGEAVADPATLLAFLQRLRTEPRVALQIRRGSERRTLVYDLR